MVCGTLQSWCTARSTSTAAAAYRKQRLFVWPHLPLTQVHQHSRARHLQATHTRSFPSAPRKCRIGCLSSTCMICRKADLQDRFVAITLYAFKKNQIIAFSGVPSSQQQLQSLHQRCRVHACGARASGAHHWTAAAVPIDVPLHFTGNTI